VRVARVGLSAVATRYDPRAHRARPVGRAHGARAQLRLRRGGSRARTTGAAANGVGERDLLVR